MTTLVNCYHCRTVIDKDNHKQCPMMFNPGNGAKYSCDQCYDVFNNSMLVPAGYRRYVQELGRYTTRVITASPLSKRKGVIDGSS